MGNFQRFTINEKTTVKILTVKPNSKLSLQYHQKRQEFWKIIHGQAEITIGNETKQAKQDDEFIIPVKTNHRAATDNSPVKILEISFGEFDEDDEVRIEDEYGRN